MRVTEVHFNHDPASAQNDALTIRHGSGQVITAPEWRVGASNPVAYVAKTLRSPFTIKVSFSDGPPNKTAEIRAVVGGGLPEFALVGGRINAAGLQPQQVGFRSDGKAHMEEFVVVPGPGEDVVATHDLVWNWQSLHSGIWTTFSVTRHRIHVVADLPKAPWCQGLVEPPDRTFPWVEALDVACAWASGAETVGAATRSVARAINSLPTQHYEADSVFVDGADEPFNLTFYLEQLTTASFTNECRGVTGALVTFANLLGDRLCPLQMWGTGQGGFDTHPIRLLSADQDEWFERHFGRHEVAARQGVVVDSFLPVYDACLQLDEADPVLAVGMPLGQLDPGGVEYLHKFVADGELDNRVVIAPRPVY